ncbi:MAG TPA: 4'-phosphopantetheinyl transferase superfamily protein [Candidatus Omnitrophota bacterium]|nr:4'-phosphopantetheinyl transferase superfamily protein [Candidatus Omnitrophota bacterium]
MSGKRKKKPLPVLVGIGIDLLALDRARDLLKRHGNSFLRRILSSAEIKKKPAYSALQLAKYFTAKEAFFKSSGLSWTDLQGFSGMWISRIRGNQFEMECSDSSLHGSGTFFRKGNIWGAKVICQRIS